MVSPFLRHAAELVSPVLTGLGHEEFDTPQTSENNTNFNTNAQSKAATPGGQSEGYCTLTAFLSEFSGLPTHPTHPPTDSEAQLSLQPVGDGDGVAAAGGGSARSNRDEQLQQQLQQQQQLSSQPIGVAAAAL